MHHIEGEHVSNWQYGAPQPPPPRRRTGLVAALLALVISLAAVTAALILVLDKNDDADRGDRGDDDRSSHSTSPSHETESAPAGDLVTGRDYTYPLPTDWTDQTASMDAAELASSSDSFSIWGSGLDDVRANLIVDLGATTDQTDLESMRAEWQAGLSSRKQQVRELPGRTIDGHDAIGVRMAATNSSGRAVASLAYLVVVDQKVHSIVLSTTLDSEERAAETLEQILDHWSWS